VTTVYIFRVNGSVLKAELEGRYEQIVVALRSMAHACYALDPIKSSGSNAAPHVWTIHFKIESDANIFAAGYCTLDADSIPQAEIKAKKSAEEFLLAAVAAARSRWVA
jgi:hypothetical protein